MSHQPDNIFAGTQVVPLVEVRGTDNSLAFTRVARSASVGVFFSDSQFA